MGVFTVAVPPVALVTEAELNPPGTSALMLTSISFPACTAVTAGAVRLGASGVSSSSSQDEKAKIKPAINKNNNDNLLSNTLFGDGAAAAIVVSDAYARQNSYSGFGIHGFHSTVLTKGKELMGWNLTTKNFEMILNAGLPNFLGRELLDVMERVSSKLRFSMNKIDHWAIHPGGKRILDEVKAELLLQNDELRHSYKVLRQYGNMSSPTILFVMAEVLNGGLRSGETILSMGFGPGISIESALLTYEDVSSAIG
ncbi:MAG: hypothetical protein HC830_13970 [Bacteroidetes bacterium]|nr:hypothetical protein [Bacteroidota bacterium]